MRVMTETGFGREIKKVVGIVKKKHAYFSTYEFNLSMIKQYLVDSNEYDTEAEYA